MHLQPVSNKRKRQSDAEAPRTLQKAEKDVFDKKQRKSFAKLWKQIKKFDDADSHRRYFKALRSCSELCGSFQVLRRYMASEIKSTPSGALDKDSQLSRVSQSALLCLEVITQIKITNQHSDKPIDERDLQNLCHESSRIAQSMLPIFSEIIPLAFEELPIQWLDLLLFICHTDEKQIIASGFNDDQQMLTAFSQLVIAQLKVSMLNRSKWIKLVKNLCELHVFDKSEGLYAIIAFLQTCVNSSNVLSEESILEFVRYILQIAKAVNSNKVALPKTSELVCGLFESYVTLNHSPHSESSAGLLSAASLLAEHSKEARAIIKTESWKTLLVETLRDVSTSIIRQSKIECLLLDIISSACQLLLISGSFKSKDVLNEHDLLVIDSISDILLFVSPNHILHLRPSLLTSLVRLFPFRIVDEALEDLNPSLTSKSLLKPGLVSAVVRIYLACSTKEYIAAHPHVKPSQLCSTVLKFLTNLTCNDCIIEEFEKLDEKLMRILVNIIGSRLKSSIISAADIAWDENDTKHVQILCAFLKRLFDLKIVRAKVIDAGILEFIVCVEYVHLALKSPIPRQTEGILSVFTFVEKLAQDSNVRYRMKSGILQATDRSTAVNIMSQKPGSSSSQNIMVFMLSTLIGCIKLYVNHLRLYRHSFVERLLSSSATFLNENFGFDRSALDMLSRANFEMPHHQQVGLDNSTISTLSCILEFLVVATISGNESVAAMSLELSLEEDTPTNMAVGTIRSVAYLLDSILRPKSSIKEFICNQRNLLDSIVDIAICAYDLEVSVVLQRILRRILTNEDLIQSMVRLGIYSALFNALMKHSGDMKARQVAQNLVLTQEDTTPLSRVVLRMLNLAEPIIETGFDL